MGSISEAASSGEKGNTSPPKEWDYEADVVVIGAGISGLVAAIRAKDLGASVLCLEANYCCGGHALCSGGHVHLGGGHNLQRRMGVVDSADQYYLDHTYPLVGTSRYNTREVVLGSADSHAAGFEFLLENGWMHLDDSTLRGDTDSYLKGGDGTNTVPRTITTDQTTKGWDNPPVSSTPGIGLTRPTEVSARKKGRPVTDEPSHEHHFQRVPVFGASIRRQGKLYSEDTTGNVNSPERARRNTV
jgi:hypothetical protein